MKHLISQAIYEYVNLDKNTQNYIAMQILDEWISWDYKKVSQSKFLFIRHLFPHLVSHNIMYRGIDINYLKVSIDSLKEHIWRGDSGRYVSWCKTLKHTQTITKSMSRRTHSNYITLISQKAIGISMLDVAHELSKTDIVNHHEWNMGNLKLSLDSDEISEVVSPLVKSFEIVGIYDIYNNHTYSLSEWKQYLPEVISRNISTYKWRQEIN